MRDYKRDVVVLFLYPDPAVRERDRYHRMDFQQDREALVLRDCGWVGFRKRWELQESRDAFIARMYRLHTNDAGRVGAQHRL